MAEHAQTIKESVKAQVHTIMNKALFWIKNQFYEDARENTEGTPVKETRCWANIEGEIKALGRLLVVLEQIEFLYWSINEKGKDSSKTWQSMAKQIDKDQSTIGFYWYQELADIDRIWHRYSSASGAKNRETLRKIAEAERKRERNDPLTQEEQRIISGDPWNLFDEVKIRIFPQGYTKTLWDRFRSNEPGKKLFTSLQDLQDHTKKVITIWKEQTKLKDDEIDQIKRNILNVNDFPTDIYGGVNDPPEFFKKVFPEVFTVKIPPEACMEFPDEVEYVRAWGFDRMGKFKSEKFPLIIAFIMANYTFFFHNVYKYDDLKKIEDAGQLMERRAKFDAQISQMATALKNTINAVAADTQQWENTMRSYPTNAQKYFTGQGHNELFEYFLKNSISKAPNIHDHVYCKHSYRVIIYPYYEESVDSRGKKTVIGIKKPVEPRKELFRFRGSSGKGLSKTIDKIKFERALEEYKIELRKFEDGLRDGTIKPVIPQMPWENELGHDHLNMPLEVDDGALSHIEGDSGPKVKGTLLSDRYKIDLIRNAYARPFADAKKKAISLAKSTPTIDLLNNYVRKNEFNPSVFENQIREVNVGNSRYSFIIRKIPDEVYEECTAYLPLHVMKEHLEIEWDNLRDDLRDGRYHSRSLTIHDYTPYMRGKSRVGFKKEKKLDVKKLSAEELQKIRNYEIKVTKDHHSYWNIAKTRKPSNLNPAFDRRAWHSGILDHWLFAGRIYYYTYSDNENIDGDILPPVHDAHISTRGMSMYIIHYVMNHVIKFEEAHRILEEIGKETTGFDYGPRNYAMHWPKDPFKPYTEVNVSGD